MQTKIFGIIEFQDEIVLRKKSRIERSLARAEFIGKLIDCTRITIFLGLLCWSLWLLWGIVS
jgi:hypothetical protein